MLSLIVAVFTVGMIGKNSFRNSGVIDVENTEDIRNLNCNVNQIFTENDVELFIGDYSANYFKHISDDVTVMIVKPMDVIRQYNFTMTQAVEIIEVVNGGAQVGDIIEIVSTGGVYDGEYARHTYDNDRPIHYGMINLMFPDNYYLIFVNPLEISDYTQMQRYREATSLFSQFNLTCDYSKPIDAPVETIAYNDYGNSEFLCDTQETIDKLVDFKTEVLEAILTEEQLKRYRRSGN